MRGEEGDEQNFITKGHFIFFNNFKSITLRSNYFIIKIIDNNNENNE